MPRDRLALRQDRHRGVVAMQPLGRQHMGFDQCKSGCKTGAGANLVGQRRDAEIDPLAGIALALPVQRLMLPELLEQDRGQKLGPVKPRGVTWNGAGGCVIVSQFRHENFSRTVWITFHCRGNHLQRLGDVLAQLRQLRRAAAGTARGRGDHDALARHVVGERLARRPLALERFHRLCPRRRLLGGELILGRGRLELFELQFHLIEQPRRALRTGAIELAAQLLDLELEMTRSALRLPWRCGFRFGARCDRPPLRRAPRSAMIIACAAARSDGSDSGRSRR